MEKETKMKEFDKLYEKILGEKTSEVIDGKEAEEAEETVDETKDSEWMINYYKYNPSSKDEKRVQKTEVVTAKDEKTAIADFKKKYAKDKTIEFVEIYPVKK